VCVPKLFDLSDVANTEKTIPLDWIGPEGNTILAPYLDYTLPLIQGEPELPKENSLPRFTKLKKVLAE